MIIAANIAIDLVDRGLVQFHSGLLFDPVFKLNIGGPITLDVIERFLAIQVEGA